MRAAGAAPLDPAQHAAARTVGILYVFTMATAVFAESFARGRLLVRGDALESARRIAEHEGLFRWAIAADLVTVAGVIVLLWALHVVLAPVGRHLALLGAFLRLAENAVAAAAVFNSLMALRLLNSPDYLRAWDADQLRVMARVFVAGHGAGLQIAFVFLGLGSAVFSYLWLRSGYIPRAFAIWGIFSSLLLSLGTLVIFVVPALGFVGLLYMVPMGIYEVGLGLWLLVRGLRAPRAARTLEVA